MWIQLSFLYLCCVVLFFAKVVIYHCMNAVFGKVARFIRIVQLKPFVEPVPDSLFHSWEKLFSPLLNTRRLFGGERSVTLFTLDLTQETLRVWMRMNQNLYLKTKGGTKGPCIIGVMRIMFPIWCKYMKWGYICPRMVISCRLVALSQSGQEAGSFTISKRIHASMVCCKSNI